MLGLFLVAVMIIVRIRRDQSANIILGIVSETTATGQSAKVVDLEGEETRGERRNNPQRERRRKAENIYIYIYMLSLSLGMDDNCILHSLVLYDRSRMI